MTMPLILATAIFWGMVIPHYLNFVRQEGKLTDLKGWKACWDMAFGEVGFLRKMARPWFDYFRPDFHPWDDDNSHYLQGIEQFSAPYARRQVPLKAAA